MTSEKNDEPTTEQELEQSEQEEQDDAPDVEEPEALDAPSGDEPDDEPDAEPAAGEGEGDEEPPANDDIEQEPPSAAPAPDAAARAAAKPLALKMARVMEEVRHVPKNGRNDFHGYDYIIESDLVDRLRGKLAEQGVAIFPSIREHVVTPIEDRRGRTQYLATVTLDVTFIDGDSGDQFTTTWVGQGVDTGDKSYYKAYTGAFKYALLKTFLVTGEESDEAPGRVRAPRGGGRKRRARR